MTDQQTEKKQDSGEPKLPRERILAEAAELLPSIPRHDIAGALSDLKGSGPITVAEAEKAVDTYLKREVKEAE